ncbi:MAG: 1,4-dihydroxy-6-naphthoate synthase [Lachnospiraceae bacterium]|nr:1,4-dihydroxy-6-naphthoate synthase [Lachnospiraceae bacterium]
MYDNLYCKVYINSNLEIEELYQYINERASGRLEPIRIIKTDWGEIDLRRNSDFNPSILENNPEDFVFWRYYLDIEPEKGIDETRYIARISKLLEELKSENIKVIASCDFEEEIEND